MVRPSIHLSRVLGLRMREGIKVIHPVRVAFEKWASDNKMGHMLSGTYDDRTWVYYDRLVELRWIVWQDAFYAGHLAAKQEQKIYS